MLADNEQLLLYRHPHWKMLIAPAFAFVLAGALAGFGAGVAQARLEGNTRTAVLVAIAALWLLVLIFQCLLPLLYWRTSHFIVTDRRVLSRRGLITHTGIDIPLSRISNVQFRNGPIDRIFGTGTLIVGSASEDLLEFADIPQVEKVHALLYQEVESARERG